jgi:proteasome lid subunit RPN8/RPN11
MRLSEQQIRYLRGRASQSVEYSGYLFIQRDNTCFHIVVQSNKRCTYRWSFLMRLRFFYDLIKHRRRRVFTVVVHTHPTNDSTPSKADLDAAAARKHLIVSRSGYTYFQVNKQGGVLWTTERF